MAWSGRFDDMFLENDNSDQAYDEKTSHYKMPVQKKVIANTQSVIKNLQQGITVNVSLKYIILTF